MKRKILTAARRDSASGPIIKKLSVGEETFALHCLSLGTQPVREYKFHPSRKWRCDFAWPKEKIAVEIEGGVWSGGRHTRGVGYVKDMEKYNALALLGFRLFRFHTEAVTSGAALATIEEAMGQSNN